VPTSSRGNLSLKRPSARPNRDVGSLVIDYLRQVGVEFVFGVPGRSIHSLLRELAFVERGEGAIRFIVGRHEGASAFMADGYARSSGRLGVCLVSAGPGATNAATGVLCADSDHSPLLLLSGECATADFHRGGFQCGAGVRTNVVRMFEAITTRSRLAMDPANVVHELDLAVRAALSTPHRAAHLSVPMDVAASFTSQVAGAVHTEARTLDDASGFEAAVKCLLSAQRPLLFLGSGAAGALSGPHPSPQADARLEALIRVVERHQLPVATSPKAKGLFPEDHPLSLRNHGMAGSEWLLRYLQGANLWSDEPAYDALMVLGSGLKQWATSGFDACLVPSGPMFQVDADPSAFGRAFPSTIGLLGDATRAIENLTEIAAVLEPSSSAARRSQFITTRVKAVPPWLNEAARTSDAHPVLPQRLMAELQTVLDSPLILERGLNLFCDIGNSTGWVWHHLSIKRPHRSFFNTGMGSMGWASGAVLGGKLGDPHRYALAISGDGAFFMNGSEVSTAAQYRIPATWVVLQDNNMNMVTHGMNATHKSPANTDWDSFYELGDPDLTSYAASLGADAYAASAPGEIVDLLPGMLRAAEKRRKPQVLIVRINELEKPPFPHQRAKPTATP
jgi:acetolactate synthase I/II/III large subunit